MGWVGNPRVGYLHMAEDRYLEPRGSKSSGCPGLFTILSQAKFANFER